MIVYRWLKMVSDSGPEQLTWRQLPATILPHPTQFNLHNN